MLGQHPHVAYIVVDKDLLDKSTRVLTHAFLVLRAEGIEFLEFEVVLEIINLIWGPRVLCFGVVLLSTPFPWLPVSHGTPASPKAPLDLLSWCHILSELQLSGWLCLAIQNMGVCH